MQILTLTFLNVHNVGALRFLRKSTWPEAYDMLDLKVDGKALLYKFAKYIAKTETKNMKVVISNLRYY